MTDNKLIEIIKCKEDFPYFCRKYVKIMNPERGLVDFVLHPFQENKVFPMFEKEKFVILRKFRQAGLSTLAAIYALWKILFFSDQRILMISITDRDSKNLMAMIRRTWEYLPDWMRCETSEFSQHVIKLETGSEIRCGTPKMGRGYSANVIVVDEAAFIPNMDEVWKSIFPSLAAAGEDGKAFVISTVNGLGNWYADIYHDAKDGKNAFCCLDLDYHEHPDYNNDEFVSRMKEQLGPRGWDQEVLGVFLSSSDTFIRPETIKSLQESIDNSEIECKKLRDDKLWIWKTPQSGRGYLLSADVAEGLGGDHDFSAFHVLDIATLEQVCEFCDNTVSTFDFAKIVNEVGEYYNKAMVVIENNSLGVAVLEKLHSDLEYDNIYWSRISKKNVKMGFLMSSKTRPLVLNTFSNLVGNKHVKINSSRLLHEIQTFEFNANSGRAEARSGRHDDLVMSMATGLFARSSIINEMPLGMMDEYQFEEGGIEPTFDSSHEKILTPMFEESVRESYKSGQYDLIDFMTDNDDEESMLKEFGW